MALNQNLQWIRISMAGGDRDSYRAVQGVDHFDRVIDNMKLLLKVKTEIKGRLNIGCKVLVTARNLGSLENLARILADLYDKTQVNYLQFNPDQFTSDGGQFWNSDKAQSTFKSVKEILEKKSIMLLRAGFFVDQGQAELDYPRTCYAHFFQAAITADGDLTYCKNCREDKEFHIGNINQKSLMEIWKDRKSVV